MKLILILCLSFILISCQTKSPENEMPNKSLSDETDLFSLDSSVAQIDENEILIPEGLTVNELMQVLIAIDGSVQSYRATANDGTTKTNPKLFEFDQIVVTSESGSYAKNYVIKYIN